MGTSLGRGRGSLSTSILDWCLPGLGSCVCLAGAGEAVHAFVWTWSLKVTLEPKPVGSGGFV